MDEELLQQMAMGDMMGGMPPMDAGMDPMMDPMAGGGSGMTTVEVPDFAVPAVMELIAILEEQIAGGAAGGMM